MRIVRWFLIIAPVVVLAVLVWHPATGWLVRRQLNPAPILDALEVEHSISGVREAEIARRYPDDYQVQLAWAIRGVDGDRVRRLQALLERFGDRPALCAHILRYASGNQVDIRRPEQNLGATVPMPPPSLPPPPAEELEELERVAILGEQLDPDNAFFPLACGYLLCGASGSGGGRRHPARQPNDPF